jgi:hypothetical protein
MKKCKKCSTKPSTRKEKVRPVHDTIGFTKYNWQLDSIYNRLGIKDSKIIARKQLYVRMTIINTLDVCITNRLKELMPTYFDCCTSLETFTLQDKIILDLIILAIALW